MSSPLFLVGFMGAGKTTVGKLVAARRGRRFVDLDDEIAAAGGAPTAALVARDEPAFRRLEAAALARLIAAGAAGRDPLVIATGGGAAAHGDNLDRMRAAGLVVTLSVSPEAVRTRCGQQSGRPLLPESRDQIAALLRRREPSYRRAHAVVDTDGLGAEAVAERVLTVEDVWRTATATTTATASAAAST